KPPFTLESGERGLAALQRPDDVVAPGVHEPPSVAALDDDGAGVGQRGPRGAVDLSGHGSGAVHPRVPQEMPDDLAGLPAARREEHELTESRRSEEVDVAAGRRRAVAADLDCEKRAPDVLVTQAIDRVAEAVRVPDRLQRSRTEPVQAAEQVIGIEDP